MRYLTTALLLSLTLSNSLYAEDPAGKAVVKLEAAKLGSTPNVHKCGKLFLAGQPQDKDVDELKKQGIQHVISLRMPEELTWDSAAALSSKGVEFTRISFQGPDTLTDKVFDRVRKSLREANKKETPVLLHCGSATRVSAVWLAYRVLDQGVDLEQAKKEAKQVSSRFPAFEKVTLDYIQRKQK